MVALPFSADLPGVGEDQKAAEDADSVFEQGDGPIRRLEHLHQACASLVSRISAYGRADHAKHRSQNGRVMVCEGECNPGDCSKKHATNQTSRAQARGREWQFVEHDFDEGQQDDYQVSGHRAEERERCSAETDGANMYGDRGHSQRSECAESAEEAKTQHEQDKQAQRHAEQFTCFGERGQRPRRCRRSGKD